MTDARLAMRADIADELEQISQHGVPSPAGARLFDVGTAAYLDFFQREVLQDLVHPGGATCRVFEGPHGSGKTHLLQLLRELALDRGFAVVRTELNEDLNLENSRLVAQQVLQHIEVRVADVDIRGIARVLETLGQAGRVDARMIGHRLMPHPGMARAMAIAANARMLSPVARSTLSRFLAGERVRAWELREYGFAGVKQPLSDRNAEHILKTIFSGLHQIGVPGTVLLFDETEQTFSFRGGVPPRRVQQGANLLRRLIDASAAGELVGVAAVFAVHPAFVEHCAVAYPALGQRLQVARDQSLEPAWRWPVLPIEAVGSTTTHLDFLEEFIRRLEALIQQCVGQSNGIAARLRTAGLAVLEENAGAGYRRDLVKRLATTALELI